MRAIGQRYRIMYKVGNEQVIVVVVAVGIRAELNKVYLVPVDIVTYASEVGLRVDPPKNNQEKKVIWARDYEI